MIQSFAFNHQTTENLKKNPEFTVSMADVEHIAACDYVGIVSGKNTSDVVYCKYYEVVYILFHTGMRISEFCGLTLKDIDLEGRTVNIDHQLQRTCDMRYVIEETKTDAGKRKLPITEDVAMMFRAIIEDRKPPKTEKVIDGHTGFLFYDDGGNPLVAMHWQHRFNHMVGRYNDIYREQMPNITPHVCRHTYCSNMAKSGMNPKTLQYLIICLVNKKNEITI